MRLLLIIGFLLASGCATSDFERTKMRADAAVDYINADLDRVEKLAGGSDMTYALEFVRDDVSYLRVLIQEMKASQCR